MPRSSSPYRTPHRFRSRIQPAFCSSTLPASRLAACHCPSASSSSRSPPARKRSRRHARHARCSRRNSRPAMAAQRPQPASLNHAATGKLRMIRQAATASVTPDQRTIRRRNGSGVISAKYAVDDTRYGLGRRCLPLQEIGVQFWICKLQNCPERGLIVVARVWVVVFQVAYQELVELPHAASALPPKARFLAQYFLSTSIFLVSAIASAGLRPLGQVWVQFMIVWQRYRRNGSSSSSRRSPVASSRVSTSQR